GEDVIRDFHVTGVQTCALPIFAFRETLHDFHSSTSPESRLHTTGAHAAVGHDLDPGAFRSVQNGTCGNGEAAPVGRHDRAAGEAADPQRLIAGQADAYAAKPSAPVDLRGDEPHLAGDLAKAGHCD